MGKELPDMKKVLFRGAVAGYNKSDVNEYIADTAKRHAEEMAEAERRINELTSELETCKSVSAMKISGLEEAEKIMRRLYHSFAEAAKSDTSAPIMSNTQQIYAGMTYGRNQLNENDMNYDNQRGFLV